MSLDPLSVWLLRAENIIEHPLSVDETRAIVAAWLRAADLQASMDRVAEVIASGGAEVGT